MKALLLIIILIFLFILDFLAMHDILMHEPDLNAEYGMFIFSLIAISIVIFISLRKGKKFK